jgi:hypothetical protein
LVELHTDGRLTRHARARFPCIGHVAHPPQPFPGRVAHRIAIGPHAGRKALTLYSVPPLEGTSTNPLLGKRAGFSLHAATVCEAHQRDRLERLCRYITRPPLATHRLSIDNRGRVVYQYKHAFRDGSTHVVLEPLDFMYRMYGMPRAPRLHSGTSWPTAKPYPRSRLR